MIMRPFIYFIIILTSLASCSTEKITFSPVGGNLSSLNATTTPPLNRNFKEKSDVVFYSSELTNQMSTFPKFKNSAVNEEVTVLKKYVKDYVYALQVYNIEDKAVALDRLERSYKKIQKLRNFLSTDDDNVINRYLVRVKSNIAKLESLNNSTNSISIQQ